MGKQQEQERGLLSEGFDLPEELDLPEQSNPQPDTSGLFGEGFSLDESIEINDEPKEFSTDIGAFDFSEEQIGTPGRSMVKNTMESFAGLGSWFANYYQNVEDIYNNAIPGLGEGVGFLGDVVDDGVDFLREHSESIKVKPHQFKEMRGYSDLTSWEAWKPSRIVATVVPSAGSTAVGLGVSFFNPIAGAIVMSGIEGGEAYNAMEAYEENTGEPIPEAYKVFAPVAVGTVNGMLEKFGISQMLKAAKVPGLQKKAAQIGVSILTESTTEPAQEYVQVFAEKMYRPEAARELYPRMAMATQAGFIMGGTMSTATTMIGSRAHVNPEGDAQLLGFDKDMNPQFRIIQPGHEFEGKEVSLSELEELSDIKMPHYRRAKLKQQLVDTGIAERSDEADALLNLTVDVMAYNKGMNSDEFIETYIESINSDKKISKGDLLQTVSGGITELGIPLDEYQGTLPESGVTAAVISADGQTYLGDPGEGHFQIVERYELIAEDGMDLGFVNDRGRYLSRGETARYLKSDNLSFASEDLDTLYQEPGTGRALSAKEQVVGPLDSEQMESMRKVFQFVSFHGTAFDFNKFSLSKVGQGEGAQAYGWGLYFADDPTIALDYAKNITQAKRTDLLQSMKYEGRSHETKRELVEDILGENKFKYDDDYEFAYEILQDLLDDPNGEGFSGSEFDTRVQNDIAERERRINELREKQQLALNNHSENSPSYRYYSDLVQNEQEHIRLLRKLDYESIEFDGSQFQERVYKVEISVPEGAEWLPWRESTTRKNLKKIVEKLDQYTEERTTLMNQGVSLIDLQRNYPMSDTAFGAMMKLATKESTDSIPSGARVYQLLVEFFGSQKGASEFLKDIGFAGVRYKAVGGQSDTRNNVVFDESYVRVKSSYSGQEFRQLLADAISNPELLEQHVGNKAKGAVQFLEDGKAIIKLFKEADKSTFIHEMAHIWRRSLDVNDLLEVNDLFDIGDDGWTRKKEESFARAYERFLTESRDDHIPRLRNLFVRARNWMLSIYGTAKKNQLPDITPEIRDFFDQQFENALEEIGEMADGEAKTNALLSMYEGFMNWIDVERVFQKAGKPELGFHIKNFFSIQSYHSLEGSRVTRDFYNLVRGDKDAEIEAILLAESASSLETHPDKESNVYKAAMLLRSYFDKAKLEYESKGGLDQGFKERLLNEVKHKIAKEQLSAEELKDLQKLEKEIRSIPAKRVEDVADIEYVHIPYESFFTEQLRKSKGSKNFKSLSLLVQAYKRKTPTIRSLIESGAVSKEDVKVTDILRSYSTMKGRDMALLNIRQAAINEGAAFKVTRDENVMAGFEAPPRGASVFRGYEIDRSLYEWLDAQLENDTYDGLSGKWRKLMNLTKMAAFWNPLFLPMYDVLQGHMGKTFQWTKPHRTIAYLYNGFKDVLLNTDSHQDMVKNGGTSQPYTSPLEDVGAEFTRAELSRVSEDTGLPVAVIKNTWSYIQQASWRFAETIKDDGLRGSVKNGIIIKPLLKAVYQASWDMAWTLDQTVRQASYNILVDNKHSSREAAQIAAKMHGDYASVPPKSRKILNTFFFTPTFKIAMGKWMVDSIKSIGNQIQGDATLTQKQLSKVFVRTLGILVAYDMIMIGMGFERDEFARRYVRPAATDLGLKELVVTWTGPHNLFLKYFQRMRALSEPTVTNKMLRFAQENSWELHPFWRISSAVVFNEKPNGQQIFYEFDSPLVKFVKRADYALASSTALYAQVMEETEFGKKGRDIFQEEYGKLMNYVSNPFIFKYARQMPAVRYRRAFQRLMAVHEEEVQASRLQQIILNSDEEPEKIIRDYIEGNGIWSTSLKQRNKNYQDRMEKLIRQFEDEFYDPTPTLEKSRRRKLLKSEEGQGGLFEGGFDLE